MSYGPRPWQQTNWDWRAAANFMLGGTGAGLIVAAALGQAAAPYPVLVGLLLVAGGLGAVWLEIGRKLRALHVFFNPFTSWMTRESFAAMLLFVFSSIELFFHSTAILGAAALAALAFVYCQARILRAATGIPAWRAPQVVPLIVTTALAEGTGLLLFLGSDILVTSLFTTAVVARALAWSGYRRSLTQPGSKAALEAAGRALLQIGTIVPLALVLGAFWLPQAALFAGIVAVLAGWWFKFVLVTRAAFNQGFALPRLPVRGTR